MSPSPIFTNYELFANLISAVVPQLCLWTVFGGVLLGTVPERKVAWTQALRYCNSHPITTAATALTALARQHVLHEHCWTKRQFLFWARKEDSSARSPHTPQKTIKFKAYTLFLSEFSIEHVQTSVELLLVAKFQREDCCTTKFCIFALCPATFPTHSWADSELIRVCVCLCVLQDFYIQCPICKYNFTSSSPFWMLSVYFSCLLLCRVA